jgi:hypothetical protein
MYVISWWEFKVVTRSSQSQKIYPRMGIVREWDHSQAQPQWLYPYPDIPWSRNCYGKDGSDGLFSFFSFSWQPPHRGNDSARMYLPVLVIVHILSWTTVRWTVEEDAVYESWALSCLARSYESHERKCITLWSAENVIFDEYYLWIIKFREFYARSL